MGGEELADEIARQNQLLGRPPLVPRINIVPPGGTPPMRASGLKGEGTISPRDLLQHQLGQLYQNEDLSPTAANAMAMRSLSCDALRPDLLQLQGSSSPRSRLRPRPPLLQTELLKSPRQTFGLLPGE